jgi:hypothetical protein
LLADRILAEAIAKLGRCRADINLDRAPSDVPGWSGYRERRLAAIGRELFDGHVGVENRATVESMTSLLAKSLVEQATAAVMLQLPAIDFGSGGGTTEMETGGAGGVVVAGCRCPLSKPGVFSLQLVNVYVWLHQRQLKVKRHLTCKQLNYSGFKCRLTANWHWCNIYYAL